MEEKSDYPQRHVGLEEQKPRRVLASLEGPPIRTVGVKEKIQALESWYTKNCPVDFGADLPPQPDDFDPQVEGQWKHVWVEIQNDELSEWYKTLVSNEEFRLRLVDIYQAMCLANNMSPNLDLELTYDTGEVEEGWKPERYLGTLLGFTEEDETAHIEINLYRTEDVEPGEVIHTLLHEWGHVWADCTSRPGKLLGLGWRRVARALKDLGFSPSEDDRMPH